MDSQKLFSIIIPTYNSERDIGVCLESICSQSFSNYEVIIVDGKSEDSTMDVIKKYVNQFDHINCVSESDNGIYEAMNKGVKMAKGSYLFFLGSDDSFYSISVLAQISKIIRTKNVDVIYGNVISEIFNGVYDGEFTYSKLCRKNICHQSIFLKQTVFDRIGGFNLKYKMCADYDHNIRWFFSSKISRLYVDLIITNYGDSGYSSSNRDLAFDNDRHIKCIKHGIGKLSINELLGLLKKEKNNLVSRIKQSIIRFYKT
jgi:glycosyltransferase involved in cell wall biosynthesis